MIYTYTSRVRYSEIDENARMTLFSLINNLQDCCTFHGEEVGVGLEYNMARGQAWIVADLQMRIWRYPRFGERIRVTTWASGFRGMIARRNFRVETEDRELLAEAATEWVFMDLTTRKPIRIPAEQEVYGLHPEETLREDMGGRKIRLPEEMPEQTPFVIQEHHLDTNRHVNNAQYVRMAMRYLPAGFETRRLRVEFKKQALLGDTIVPRAAKAAAPEEAESVWYAALTDEAGEPYFTAEFTGEEERENDAADR